MYNEYEAYEKILTNLFNIQYQTKHFEGIQIVHQSWRNHLEFATSVYRTDCAILIKNK